MVELPHGVQFGAFDRRDRRWSKCSRLLWAELCHSDLAPMHQVIEPTRPGGPASLAACWAHARRKFFELHTAGLSDTATRTVERMAGLWEIEGSTPERIANSWPNSDIEALMPWNHKR